MKKWIFVTVLACCVAVARANLVITEVMSSSSHTNTVANGDWWELYNSGLSSIDLTGYSWDDNSAAPGSADFNGQSINAGQAIIICQESVGQEQAWRDAWGLLAGVLVINLGNTEFQNFGSGGDEVHVYDSSNVEIASTTFGAASTGFTFAWDGSGASLGVSALGVYGAFQATSMAGGGPDVGSPGYVAVPEPVTLAFFGLGGLILMLRRRIAIHARN